MRYLHHFLARLAIVSIALILYYLFTTFPLDLLAGFFLVVIGCGAILAFACFRVAAVNDELNAKQNESTARVNLAKSAQPPRPIVTPDSFPPAKATVNIIKRGANTYTTRG